jgi:Protein of unknown function (DUF1631)
MASQSAILQQCFQEAAAASKGALERCVDHAIGILQEAELKSMKVAERDELGQAWRDLLKHKPEWSAQYPRELLVAFKAAAAAATKDPSSGPTPLASGGAKVRLDTLALVDDTKLTEAIESSRLLQRIVPMVEQPLSELDGLISSVQGLPAVSPELNPVRPEIFAQTLRLLMTAVHAEQASMSLWIKHMAEPLGRELKGIYEKQVELLARAKVQSAGYRVLQSPSGATTGAKPGAGPDGTAAAGARQGGPGGGNGSGWGSVSGGLHPAGGPNSGSGGLPPQASHEQSMHYADLSGVEINDALFQDFLFHGGGAHARQQLAPSFYEAVEEELAALRQAPQEAYEPAPEVPPPQYQAMPVVDRPQRFVDVLSQLSSKVWGAYSSAVGRSIVRTELKKDAKQVGQVLGLEVVRKVVNQVAQDPRLLVPVREAIVALEPSLLRLAMVDPRFLSDERHPGRRLIEGVAQRSFKYNDEFSEEFNTFFQPVAQSFNALNGLTAVENPQPFGEALSELETSWVDQDQQEESQRETVLQTLRVAEQRQAQADQIAYDLSLRSDLEQAPAVVLDFLFGPWSLVMANARMKAPNQPDPGGYGAVISDLLWSVKLNYTLNEPAKLIAMIPGVLGKLRSGLASIGHTQKETEPFFDALMKLHQPVLELRRLRSQRDASESSPMALEIPLPDIPPATPEQRTPKAAGQLWLGPKEQSAAGFEEITPSDRAALNAAPGDSSPAPLEATESEAAALEDNHGGSTLSPAQILLGLREGSWVDLFSKERWLRAQLIWASTKGTLFMFVSHGGQPHSMTKRSCEKLIRDRHLRPVDMQDVVSHALDALAQEKAAASQPVPLG